MTLRQPETRGRSRVIRGAKRLGLILAALALIIILVPVGMGLLTMWGVTHPPCSVGPLPEDYGLTAEAVFVPSRVGVNFPGYFFAGINGATIIVPPAYGQNRGGLLHEVDVLVRHGFNVLTYDSRTCQGMAPHSLGIWEAQDIFDALDYLRQRDDVDINRVGLHGFSQAGASNLFAAAESPLFKAVVAEGGYVDYGAQTLNIGGQQDWFSWLFSLGARFGYRLSTGLSLDALKPVEHLAEIAPRQVLFVYGAYEVTLDGARRASEAHDHIELWVVPDGTHGSYLASAGEGEFAARIAGFFSQALHVSR